MTQGYSQSRPDMQRRRPVQQRSLWRHVLAVLVLLALIAAALYGAARYVGQVDDAVPSQVVELPTLPDKPTYNRLDGDGQTLPDLLDGDVAAGENPTTALAQNAGPAVDALGNPIDNNGLAGGAAGTAQTPTARPNTINGGLIRAPIPALLKQSPFGPVPTKASDGRTSAKVFARTATVKPGTKAVAIVIGGMGINTTLTQRAINELPADVTLSFAAHAPNLQAQINQARAKGHEVLLELPMESALFDASEPGADRALMGNGDNARVNNFRNLDWLLSRASGYFGVINYNGDVFLARSDAVVPILGRIEASGLGFIYDGSATAPSLPALSSASGLPFAEAFTLLDDSPDRLSIDSALERLSGEAASGGSPIGVGFSYPQTLDAVKAFTATLDNKALSLVPASAMLQGGT